MAKKLLVFVAVAVLVNVIASEEAEQKKRGAAKTTSLNAIPTGSQKPDYSYSIYQSPSTQNTQQSTVYTPVSNSFYPSQTANQYYNQPNDPSLYPPQPQINLLPPSPPQSQFLPLNFVPNPGYQSKYQIVPSKQGGLQLAIIQQQPLQGPVVQIPQGLYNPGAANPQVFAPGNVGQNFQPFQLSSNYLGHPQQIFFAQPNQPVYNNNLLYPNPLQSFYNYYPSNAQAKYNIAYGGQPVSGQEYDKIPGPITQAKPEDNDLAVHSTEYVPSSDASYKSYSVNRGPTYQTKP